MSKMKRLLALVICLLLTITSLPVTQLVFADNEFVVLHETTFTNVNDATWTEQAINKQQDTWDDHMTASVDENGYYTFTQTTTTGTGTNSQLATSRLLGEMVIAKDDANRTEVVTNNINGKYTIELDVETLVKKFEGTNNPYYAIEFFSGTSKVLLVRLYGANLMVIDTDSVGEATYKRSTDCKNGEWVYAASTEPQNFKLRLELDTVNKTLSSYYNDVLMTSYAGTLVSEEENCAIRVGKPIDSIRIFGLSRADVGSYIKFKEVKITQNERATNATLSALPAKLEVADVNNVTETSVTLPAVSGVTWASADETAATVSGNTLTFIPSTTGTKEAVVTATFTTDGYEYVKTYKMTLAQGEEVIVPEPTPTPAEAVVSVDKVFGYADANSALADGWSYGIFDSKTYVLTPNQTLNSDFVVENGVPTIKQTEQTIMKAGNTGVTGDLGTAMVFDLPAGPVAIDEENGTSIINEDGKYHGVIKVDIDGEFNAEPVDVYYHTPEGSETSFKVNPGYANVNVIGDYIATQWRIRASDARAMSNSSESPSDIKTEKKDNILGGTPKEGIIISAEVDTVEETVKACVPVTGNGLTGSGTTWAKLTSKKDLTYVDRIIAQHMVRLPLTAYSKIKSVKVTTIDPKFGDETTAVLAQLPATLVGDINGATETTVSLPSINGVEWVSMDENVATVNGSTLNLIPSKTGTKDAVVKAVFTTDGIKYSKEYKFTLAMNDNLTVTYYVDGKAYSAVSVKKNEKASAIDAPVKTGMMFDGWFLEGADTAFNFDTAITEDVNLYAKYSTDPNYNPTTDGVVAFSKSFNYATTGAAEADGWLVGEYVNAEFTVENGYPTLKQIEQTVTTNNTSATAEHGTSMTYVFPAGPVAMDIANRTKIINEDGKYTGTVKVVVDGEFDVGNSEAYTYKHTYTVKDEQTGQDVQKTANIKVNPSYANMNVRGDFTGAQWRIRATHAQAMSNSSEAPSDIKTKDNSNSLGGIPKEGVIMSTTVDINAETVTAEVPVTGNGLTSSGSTWAKLTDKKDLTYLDRIVLTQMIRLPVGSYSKVKGITITTLDPQFGAETTAKLNLLPVKLDVNDINAVTTAEFTLPEVAGVVWTSSDDALISIEGNKATVNRVKGEAKEVTVKATFKADGINYSKEYEMTLATGENLVKYYDINGKLINAIDVKDGEKASEINAPAVEHYNFIGWFEEGATTSFDFDTAINSHVSLYAKYETKTYNVIFKADGNTVATLTGKYNDVVTGNIPSIPAKNGFTSVGWYVGDTDEAFGAGTLITGPDMVINAKYVEGTLVKRTVTFKVDGEVYATDSVFDGYTVAMPGNPTKANYTFAYWTLDGVEFKADTAITKNTVLEAKFNPNPVKVNFYMDDTMTELFQTGIGYYNTAYGTLPTPVKDMYKFTGWKFADGTDFTEDTVVTEEVSVYATWQYSVKVILDEDITKYTSAKGNNVEFIDTTTTWTESFIDDGYVVRVTNQSPSDRDRIDILNASFKAPIGEYDEANRTQIYNSKLVGDYEVEIVYDAKLSGKHTAPDGTSVSAPWGLVSTGSISGTTFTPLLANRIYNDSVHSYNASDAAKNSFNATGTTGAAIRFTYPSSNVSGGVASDVSLKIRYNPVEAKAQMSMGGVKDVAIGSPQAKLGFINAFYFAIMPCNQVGDYIKIKGVKVTQYNDYSDTSDFQKLHAVLDELPASVVENPYDAKGTVNLPEIRGVKWSSTDEAIINSTTGEITPWYSDTDVVVKATISSGIFSYEKYYTVTVKGIGGEPEEIINETFTSEDDLTNWAFENLEDIAIGNYSVDENGVKISKTSPIAEPDKEYETKRYFGFYDLYTEVDSADHSITEVKDHEGVYDVTVDYSKFVNSKLPVNIAVGYRNGSTFYDFGMLKFTEKGTFFAYQETGESKTSMLLNVGDSEKLTFRIDNINSQICLYNGDKVLVDRLSFKTVMGEDARINSVKVELDTNNELGDYVIVKGISVSKVFGGTAESLNDVVSASSNIDVNDITANPDSVSGTINALPETIGGYDVVWSSSSNQIDLESGEVFHDTTAKKVYLYAEIYDADAKYPYVVRKTFELNVRAAINSAETDKFIINSLGRITNQNYDDIRYDLAIPQVDGITWTSSRTDIIGNDGKIIDNAVVTAATPVTITATSNGVSKNYNLTVSPRTPLTTVATGNNGVTFNVGSVENAKLSGDTVTSFTYTKGSTGKVNIVNTKGDVIVSLVADAAGFHFDYVGSDYKKYDLATAEIKIITMPDVDKVAIFVNNELVVDYATLKFATDYIAKVESEFNVGEVKVEMDKFGILQSNLDNFNYFEDASKGYADKNGINLPTATLTNANVTWTSSDTSLLANNGKVTVPNTMTNVNLAFEIADGSNADIAITKNFVISVDCANDKNVIYNIIPEVSFKDPTYHQSNATDGNINTIFKITDASISDSEMVFDLGTAKTFNTLYILQKEANMQNYEVYYSNDGSSWNLIKSGDMTGKCSDLIRFTSTNAQYIKLVTKKCTSAEIDIAELKVFFGGTDLELAEYDIENVAIDVAPTGTKISLPETGANGTEFTWESSDEKIIDENGNITRPSSATTVKLTVKAVVDGQELSKTFDVYVDTKSTSGPSQVGGGSGGGGGGAGGMASGGAASTPVIGDTEEDTIYSEDIKPSESTTSVYNDVKETDWYYEAVKTLTSKGIVSGDGTGYFYPTNNVTREQFVKMILEAIEVEVKAGTHSFGDVEGGAWYENYIATAVSNGIVNGVGGGNFGVGTNITRQDMAVLIERVLAYKNIEVAKEEAEPFADEAEVADYAKEAVANMKAIGLIQGYNNNYNPKDNLTRAEAATVIASLLELLAK